MLQAEIQVLASPTPEIVIDEITVFQARNIPSTNRNSIPKYKSKIYCKIEVNGSSEVYQTHAEELNDHPVWNENLQVASGRLQCWTTCNSVLLNIQIGIEAANEFSVESIIVLKLLSEHDPYDGEGVLIGDEH
jgi:Ca2+-dependent lipid-binding protein